MTTLNVKIVGTEGESVLVKFASENSAKTIDEYDAVAFQPKVMGYHTVDEFIEGIKPGLLAQVIVRDRQESAPADVDLSAWAGYQGEHMVTTDTDQTGKEVIL
jgi:hypothetical protein